mmetsp:Transcript_45621/g.89126  ORF Transcript_45621/g.89126 Transcript_45621/m.89126 type:complete len:429 (+) Transcript_45621:4278-5564(+)
MFHLKTRVQFEEEKFPRVGIEEVLYGSCPHVSNLLGESLRGPFHLFEGILGSNNGWTLLENLLEPPLRRTVASVQCHGVAVLVPHDLDLEMPRVLAQLHEKDGRSDDLVRHLDVGVRQILLFLDEADSLAAPALGGFDHDTVFVADAFGGRDCLLDVAAGGAFECFIRDGPLVGQLSFKRAVIGSSPRSGPRNAGHLRGLRKDIRRNLVSEHTHDRPRGPDKFDSQLVQSVWQIGIFGSMSPPRPHGVNVILSGDPSDHVNVGVIVRVLPRGHLHEGIREADKLGVRADILGGGHRDELDALLVPQLHVGPLAHGEDGLGGGHAVVGDENLADRATPAARFHVVVEKGVAGRLLCVDRRRGIGGRHHGDGARLRVSRGDRGHTIADCDAAEATSLEGGDKGGACESVTSRAAREGQGRRSEREPAANH